MLMVNGAYWFHVPFPVTDTPAESHGVRIPHALQTDQGGRLVRTRATRVCNGERHRALLRPCHLTLHLDALMMGYNKFDQASPSRVLEAAHLHG